MQRVLCILVVPFTVLLAGNADAQPHDKSWSICTSDTDNDNMIIQSCMAVVHAGNEADANLAIAFKNLCLAYNDKGDHDRAIQNCDQAIKLNAGFIDAYLFRGHAYFNKGDNDRAIQDYDKAITLDPNEAGTFVERGAAYHIKGDNVRAIEDLDQAIRLDPNDATAFYVRGAAYQAENENDHAIQDYSKAIKLAPNFAASHYLRGVLEKQMGDISGGDADIAQARHIDPDVGK